MLRVIAPRQLISTCITPDDQLCNSEEHRTTTVINFQIRECVLFAVFPVCSWDLQSSRKEVHIVYMIGSIILFKPIFSINLY
jgi:hypothetical protein